jgi:pimeloyl-[acyl-carrier protein] methyl ester esterase
MPDASGWAAYGSWRSRTARANQKIRLPVAGSLIECSISSIERSISSKPKSANKTAYSEASRLGHAPKERFVLVGESFSGPIAIELAASLPSVVGLVLASSFARHPMPSLLAPLARIIDLAWIPNSITVAALLGSTPAPELKAHLIQVLARLPRDLIRVRAFEVLRVDKRNRLREVRCPMLCLHGRLDRLVSKKYVDETLSAKPECQVRWFEAPHMLLETHPDAAADAINQFCLRLS